MEKSIAFRFFVSAPTDMKSISNSLSLPIFSRVRFPDTSTSVFLETSGRLSLI